MRGSSDRLNLNVGIADKPHLWRPISLTPSITLLRTRRDLDITPAPSPIVSFGNLDIAFIALPVTPAGAPDFVAPIRASLARSPPQAK
ncbi:MAG: hypothetical protein AAGB13_15800 [Cyanobacteria bacterium P01_F01_bin.33]